MTTRTPTVIEDVDADGTTWLVSFDGPNPTAEMCVRVTGRDEAFKLKRLVQTIGAADCIEVLSQPIP